VVVPADDEVHQPPGVAITRERDAQVPATGATLVVFCTVVHRCRACGSPLPGMWFSCWFYVLIPLDRLGDKPVSFFGGTCTRNRTHAMRSCPCRSPPNSAARALLHHLLEQGDIVGRDAAGRTIIQLSVNDYVLETLLTFDAEPADLEPQADDKEDGPPVLIELAQPRIWSDGGPWGQAAANPWHAEQRSSSRCTGRSCRASPWTTRTSSA
jgi:hypothetical protein